ncbi:cupin domain-containing protein [Pedobacter antarcticus]|uniref:cupin domain-containing protein n=1 Tax=Pedobacter antarcticus TaxID=34086 RepID=UPI001C55E363|nr:cupin domain-containing protein [Pedobacter antarcticus]
MKCILKINVACLLLLFYSCNYIPAESNKETEKRSIIFAQGDKNTTQNFNGEVWVKSLIDADSLNETAVGNVTFAPGARSKWHSHPAGQILMVTDGVGYYQEKGQSKVILRKGSVIKCPPNTPHWHGASPDTAFVQLAITSRTNGPTVWLQTVTEKEYRD